MSWFGRLGAARAKHSHERSLALGQRVLFEMRLEQTANRVPLVFSVGFLAVRIGVTPRELEPALGHLEREGAVVRDATGKYGLGPRGESCGDHPTSEGHSQ